MTKEESSCIVDKIKVYRQNFLTTEAVYKEWYRILELYDYDDVEKKLDEYFRNGENFGRYPDAYYLTKFLKKHNEKLKIGVNYVRCQNCQQVVELTEYDGHLDRCNSVEYLCDISEKHYQKCLNKEKLFKMNNAEFEKVYWKFCEQLFDDMDDSDILKHSLKNAILSHYGHQPEYAIEEIVERMGK